MMLLLFDNNFSKRSHGFIVEAGQLLDLFLHVAKHDPLDGDRGGSDGVATGDTGYCPEDEAAHAAPNVASTTTLTSSR